jgi:hypothetical protein
MHRKRLYASFWTSAHWREQVTIALPTGWASGWTAPLYQRSSFGSLTFVQGSFSRHARAVGPAIDFIVGGTLANVPARISLDAGVGLNPATAAR